MKTFHRLDGAMMRVGIDVGGTFTDVVMLAPDGSVWTTKVPTTPTNPVEGALAGVRQVLSLGGASASDVRFVGHGTTIATNLVVEGNGARAALVTTRGFRDILEIRRASRHDRADLYDLFFRNPPALVPRALRYEVDERIQADGGVGRPLSQEQVVRVVDAAVEAGAEALAICLINSPVNPAHERTAAALARRSQPNVFVSASVEVNPELQEYERTSTTAMNAVLGPRVGGYIRAFVQALAGEGGRAEVLFMRSNGGLATPALTSDLPVTLLESGPAGGVTAAAKLCQRLGVSNAICGDMGGTTFDVSLIRAGMPEVRSGSNVHTYAVRAPTIDIESIGAGGGSIAWIDEAGGLHVGPRSAGATPGPACYGRGGTDPTVTDCNVVLGYVDPGNFLGGAFDLDTGAAYRAVEERLARPLGLTVTEAARTVRDIANALMAQAIRLMTVERGYDPREFVYLCYGGGGPVHAVDLAAELGIPTVIVPRLPGLFSAVGMLAADQIYDVQTPVSQSIAVMTPAGLDERLRSLDAALSEQLARAGVPSGAAVTVRRADCLYTGQAEALSVELPDAPAAEVLGRLRGLFEDAHRRQWNFTQPDRAVTLVNLRAQARIPTAISVAAKIDPGGVARACRSRRVLFASAEVDVPVYRRDDLRPGDMLAGPGFIEEASSCLAFRAGDRCSVDSEGNLMVTLGSGNG